MMPGGTPEAYKYIEPIVQKVGGQLLDPSVNPARSTLSCI
jgi:6-phosphogluconate dehydrogenase